MEKQSNSHPSMRALQAVDRRLGPLAGLLLRPLALGRRRSSGSVRRLLVIKFWGLGSLQLATPAIRALRRQHPEDPEIPRFSRAGKLEQREQRESVNSVNSVNSVSTSFRVFGEEGEMMVCDCPEGEDEVRP